MRLPFSLISHTAFNVKFGSARIDFGHYCFILRMARSLCIPNYCGNALGKKQWDRSPIRLFFCLGLFTPNCPVTQRDVDVGISRHFVLIQVYLAARFGLYTNCDSLRSATNGATEPRHTATRELPLGCWFPIMMALWCCGSRHVQTPFFV